MLIRGERFSMSIERRLERLEAASVLSQHLQPIEVIRRLSQSEEEVLDQLEASGRIVRADRDRVQFIVIETWRDRRKRFPIVATEKAAR
jgi:hypothetical protein